MRVLKETIDFNQQNLLREKYMGKIRYQLVGDNDRTFQLRHVILDYKNYIIYLICL